MTMEVVNLTSHEKNCLRRLAESLWAMPRNKRLAWVYAWSTKFAYDHKVDGNPRWMGKFQAILHEVLDLAASHGRKDSRMFEALVTGDVEALKYQFRPVIFSDRRHLVAVPGVRTRMPKKGFAIFQNNEKAMSVASEQLIYAMGPLSTMALDRFDRA